jgi:hypothetical protein
MAASFFVAWRQEREPLNRTTTQSWDVHEWVGWLRRR